MSRLASIILILLGFSACDDGAETPGDAGGACVPAQLIAQCPLGTSPVAGVQAESACGGAAGGVVLDGAGQATGQCYGVGGCRVVCQFAVPCRCGVASVSGDGVVCATCEGAAACGNGVCEGGESPQSCPIDCGVACNAGERRCTGTDLEECSLQGRWDTLACPAGEVCDFTGGSAQCIRDPGIIRGDAGVEGPDGGPVPEGRVLPGQGPWPVLADLSTGATPRPLEQHQVEVSLETAQAPVRPSEFAQLMAGAGAPYLDTWRFGAAGALEGLGTVGRVVVGPDGTLLTRDPAEFGPVDLERFCQAWTQCIAGAPADGCPGAFANYQRAGAWRLGCLVDAALTDHNCGGFGGVDEHCEEGLTHPYPAGVTVNVAVRVGDRLVGANAEWDRLVALDLATGEVRTGLPVGELRVAGGTGGIALSADGQVAAWLGQAGSDHAVVVWSLETGAQRVVLPLAVGTWTRVALSPDGQLLALAAGNTGNPALDGAISLWSVADERRLASILPPERGDLASSLLAFSPNGRELAVDTRFEVEIWHLGADLEKRQTLAFDGAEVVGPAAYAPDGRTLALKLGPVGLWDTQDGQRWQAVAPAGGDVKSLAFSADGQQLLVLEQFFFISYRFQVLTP